MRRGRRTIPNAVRRFYQQTRELHKLIAKGWGLVGQPVASGRRFYVLVSTGSIPRSDEKDFGVAIEASCAGANKAYQPHTCCSAVWKNRALATGPRARSHGPQTYLSRGDVQPSEEVIEKAIFQLSGHRQEVACIRWKRQIALTR